MSFNLQWEERGVIKRFWGDITVKEVQDATIRVEASERFDVCRYVINDFTECASINIDYDLVKEIAVIDGVAMRTNSNIRVAVVTTMPEIIGMAEAYAKSPYHSYPTQIFSTLKDARLWVVAKE